MASAPRAGAVVAAFVRGMPFGVRSQEKGVTSGNASVSGHSPKRVAQHIISTRDFVAISYPQAQSAAGARADETNLTPRRIFLTQPTCFDRQDAYIWRDAEGVWQIQAASDHALAVAGRIEAKGSITPKAVKVTSTLKHADLTPNLATLNATGAVADKVLPVCFKPKGGYTQEQREDTT